MVNSTIPTTEILFAISERIAAGLGDRDATDTVDTYAGTIIVDGWPYHLSFHAARVLGYAINGHSDAIRITGCGMDMGFALVYELSSALFSRDENDTQHSGGYALN